VQEHHPLAGRRIGALLGLLSVLAIGAALMMAPHVPSSAFFVGLLLELLSTVASVSLFWKDFAAVVCLTERVSEVTQEAYLGIVAILIGAFLAAYIGYCFWPRAAPLKFYASTPQTADYPPGTDVAGIKWKPYYTDLRVNVSNPTLRDYVQFDATIRTDLIILQIVEATGVANCKIIAYPNDPDAPHNFMMVDGSLLITSRHGRTQIPLLLNPGSFASESYRLLCDQIPRESSLEFIVAIATLAKPHDPQTFDGFFIGLHNPSWVILKARYEADERPRSVTFEQCINGPCVDMPYFLSTSDHAMGFAVAIYGILVLACAATALIAAVL
jgi:hypothetical protein